MFLGVQIVSICVMLCVIVNFLRERKLPILSTTWYMSFLGTAVANFFFEMFSLLTLYEILPSKWNRISHQLFYISLVGVLQSFFIFVDFKCRKERRYTKLELFSRVIPFVLTGALLKFGDVEYYIDGNIRYSQGSMVYGIFVIAAIFMVTYFMLIYYNRKTLRRREKMAFIFIFASVIVFTSIQLCVPSLLLTSLSVVIMALNVYIAFENPRELVDFEIEEALNNAAFTTMINEYIARNEKFYIVSLTMRNSQMIIETNGYQTMVNYMRDVAVYMRKCAGTSLVFHPKKDWMTVVFSDKKKFDKFIENHKNFLMQEKIDEHGTSKYFISVLECPKYANKTDEIGKIFDYIDRNKYEIKETFIVIDDNILEEKNKVAKIEAIVQDAIVNDGFDVYYQPIYSNSKKSFVSSEALVRLKDTTTVGFVSPEIFIPISEQNGMIHELGNVVFRKVCHFASENKLQDYGVHYIEVNLSGAQFMDDRLNEMLSECVKEHGILPEFINLEITETASIEAASMLEYNIHRLKENNFKFSMDDFGTGYSNLAKIAQSSFDMIKLDKSLIWPCFNPETEKEARIILESSVDMILKLGKDIVAEGVETKAQVDYLTELGVEYLQGYYFSKPIPEDQYLEFLKNN